MLVVLLAVACVALIVIGLVKVVLWAILLGLAGLVGAAIWAVRHP